MKDVLLTHDGDLFINKYGDIEITDSVRQAVRIRLLWFFKEWRFAPDYGVPYFEEVLKKNPNLDRIKRIIYNEVMSVNEVMDARNIQIKLDAETRTAKVTMDVVLSDETYREEVVIDARQIRLDA